MAPSSGSLLRQNEDFPENFSIGLIYKPRDGTSEITLLRCNGPHTDYHVHRASAEMIDAGLRPESRAASTKDYASFEEAVRFFLRTANVADAVPYFTSILQRRLPFPGEDTIQ